MLFPSWPSDDARNRVFRHALIVGAGLMGLACAGGLAYELAIEHRPPPPAESYYLKVQKALRAGDHDYAIAQCRIGVAIRPDYDEGYIDMADAFAAKGDTLGQVRAFEDLLRVHPRHNLAHGRLAEVYTSLGRYAEAVSHYGSLLEVEPRNEGARYNLGVCLLEAGKPAEAAEELGRAILLDASDARAHNNLGVALIQLGRPDRAVESFSRAAALEPGNAGYRGNLDEGRRRVAAATRPQEGP